MNKKEDSEKEKIRRGSFVISKSFFLWLTLILF